MLLELNYYQPAKQDKFPNCLLSQHLHTASLLLPCEALPVVVFTLRCLTGLESGLDAESRCSRTTLGEKCSRDDIRSKTNSLTSKSWQRPAMGPWVSQLSSQMPF